jgi:hypothetical protein
MKKKLIFIIPILALLGFLAIKPPAIGSEKKEVIVTPTSTATTTPLAKPNLRDFDGDGNGPAHHEPDSEHHDGLIGEGHHDGGGERHHDGLHESDDD